MYISETIQKRRTNNKLHNKYKYTYYQNTQTQLSKHRHIYSPAHYKTI